MIEMFETREKIVNHSLTHSLIVHQTAQSLHPLGCVLDRNCELVLEEGTLALEDDVGLIVNEFKPSPQLFDRVQEQFVVVVLPFFGNDQSAIRNEHIVRSPVPQAATLFEDWPLADIRVIIAGCPRLGQFQQFGFNQLDKAVNLIPLFQAVAEISLVGGQFELIGALGSLFCLYFDFVNIFDEHQSEASIVESDLFGRVPPAVSLDVGGESHRPVSDKCSAGF